MNEQIAIRPEQQSTPALVARQGPPDFHILGALGMTVGGQPQKAGPPREQRLLVALLSAKGMPVTHERLMDAIWDDRPKSGALNDLHKLVSGLRKRLATAGLNGVLTAGNGTYTLDIPAAHVDVHRFHDLTDRVRQLAEGDDQRAVALLEEALRLYRGEPLAGLRGRWVDGYRHLLTEERRVAELKLYEAAIRVGQSRDRRPGLNGLFLDRPEDEWVAWLYMHALYRVGQQTEALAVKRQFSDHLLKTNGVENSKALDDLYERILRRDADLLLPEAVTFPAGEAGVRGPRASWDSRRKGPDGSEESSHDEPHVGGYSTPGAADAAPGWQPWLVRIPIPGSRVVGMGFLVDERHVLTCAHVVTTALGLPMTAGRPTKSLQVEFPELSAGISVAARVAGDGWFPSCDWGGLAVLRIEKAPVDAKPAPLREPPPPWHGTFAVRPGFVGAPVWHHHLDAVIGMVTSDGQPDAGPSSVVPVSVLESMWPQLEQLIQRSFVDVLGPGGYHKQFELTGAPFTVGRSQDRGGRQLDVALDDPGRVVSRKQCEIIREDGAWWVLGHGPNGTWVINPFGSRNPSQATAAQPEPLTDGRRLRLLQHDSIRFRGEDEDGNPTWWELRVRDASLTSPAGAGNSDAGLPLDVR